jgi:molybdopterin-binding protein
MEIHSSGSTANVVLDVGFRLVALVSRQAVEELDLAVGSEVAAAFKASAVHLIPHGSAPDWDFRFRIADGTAL